MKFEQIFSLQCQTEQAASQTLTTKAGGRRCRPFPVTSQREEVLAGHPGEQREEVPLTGYSLMAAIIHLIVFKKMRPFVASSDHAQMLGNLDFLHRLLEGGLDRLGDVLGGLGGNGLEVLGLLDGRFDALAQEGGLQLDDFRQRLGADQGFEVGKTGLGIGTQSGDGLERQVVGNGLGGLVGRLQSLLGLLGAVFSLA